MLTFSVYLTGLANRLRSAGCSLATFGRQIARSERWLGSLVDTNGIIFRSTDGVLPIFRITLYPADEGDCVLLTFGEPDALRHILIDGGTSRTYPRLRPSLVEIAAAGEPLVAAVVSHIDADHIGGILALANDPSPPLIPQDIWFNTFDEIADVSRMGERQAEELAVRVRALKWPLNRAFGGGPILVEEDLRPMVFDGLAITVLSPDPEKCRDIHRRWLKWREQHPGIGIQRMGGRPAPGPIDVMSAAAPSPEDTEPPNGSSIAMLIEYGGKAVLIGTDSHPYLLESSLRRLAAIRGVERIAVDVFKVSHHGSSGNTTASLCAALDCSRFAISTSGARHGHPRRWRASTSSARRPGQIEDPILQL